MRHILATSNVDILAQFAWSRVLLAFDFDGTLAPIIAEREDAKMRQQTHNLLEEVCRRYPCAVISGRSRADVSSRLKGLRLSHIVGNMGIEPGDHMKTYQRQIEMIKPQLTDALSHLSGLEIEDKKYSLAVHYRRSRRKRDARTAIYHAVMQLPELMHIVPGKLVLNVVPDKAPHKGDALLRVRAKEKADTAIFVGDDITDEDIFELDQPGRLLTIRVGNSKRSAANYYIRSQREIDRFLSHMIMLREQPPKK